MHLWPSKLQFYWKETHVKFEKFLRTSYFTEHLRWLLLAVSGFQPATLLKKRFQQSPYSVNFAKFLRKSHLATKRRDDVLMTSLCTLQWRRRYVSNETPNNVSMERRQDVSMVCLHDILLERCDGASKGRNNDVSSVRFRDVTNNSQIKHPTTSHWYVTKTSQWYISARSR